MVSNLMIHVLGFGNILHGNDGFAARVLEKIVEKQSQNPRLNVHFAGTAGLNAMSLFDDCQQVLVVDVIHHTVAKRVAKAGLAWYSVEEVIALDHGANDHGQGLAYLFKALKAVSDPLPAIRCLLCASEMPQAYCLTLSDAVQQQVDQAVELICQEVG